MGDEGTAARGLTREIDESPPPALRRQVRLLGEMLGQVLQESGGTELLADVERLRRAAIALRREPVQDRRREVIEIVAGFDLARAEQVASAFTTYFQLINLAEEHHRVRTLRERGRGADVVSESLAAAVRQIREEESEGVLAGLLARLSITPVLTAHPTEARRRAVVDAIQRVALQLERLDEPGLAHSEEADVRRRLLEEITILWRTAQLRQDRPTPLYEVRRVMAVFDETLFRLVPAVYRELDRALAPDTVGTRPPQFEPFLEWGSWVGGDRDGNPTVTADVTRDAMAIQAEHVLRGLENATRRIGRSMSASATSTPPSRELLAALERDEAAHPASAQALRERAGGEPHRRKLTLCAERLAATRTGAGAGYAGAEEFLVDLRIVQESLAGAGAARLAYGELQHLIWQAQTFGFHLASLEIRQHSEVHARILEELIPGASGDAELLDRIALQGWQSVTPQSDEAREALATIRVMAELQQRYGPRACHRYVVSFTRSAADIVAVRALARLAVPDGLRIDVVPLFETRADLDAAPRVLDELLGLPGERPRLEVGGRRMEVMLGYSDSAKDAGYLSANLTLFAAQGALAQWARRSDVALTLFHGRGGAVGRGGGPTNRAVRGQAPGSVSARFKITEQGEVIFERYRNIHIARRHVEQVTNAVLVASTPRAERALTAGAEQYAEVAEQMAKVSERVYRDLVEQEGFAEFFSQVTPSPELSELLIGSRPSRRKSGGDLASLRAIPWVFAWTQSRCNLAGWYGLGSGLEAVAGEPGGLQTLREMYRDWPFFTSLIENAELSLVKADMQIAELYLALSDRAGFAAAIRAEYETTVSTVLAVAEHERLLQSRPVLRRAVDLRNPYVDALSFIQLRCLSALRRGIDDPHEAARVADLTLITVNGVAAGLQNTG
ncbi:MAG TPA: phosphoenolpyruvate carboxylase [Egibacteraceae bacterium]|nr:phosphoenolpyruvate carboxylase [Egibacteraceae bacterium]